MNILIISVAFPPRNSPGALRPHSWAKYWSRAGHRVTVLTTQKELHEKGLASFEEKTHEDGYKVCEIGFGSGLSSRLAEGSSQSSPSGQKSGFFRKIRLINDHIAGLLGPLYDIDLPYAPLLLRAGKTLGRQEKYDIVISTFSPATCHIVAHELKKDLRIPWVADYRDFWSGSEFSQGVWPFSAFADKLEKRTIQTADLLMAVAEPMRQAFIRRYSLPCVTVENGFDPEDYDCLETQPLFPRDGKLRFVYTGAIYGKRNPAPFFEAVRELINEGNLSADGLEILFYGRRLDSILRLAESLDILHLVKIMGLVDRHTALRAQRDADGLLFLEGQDYVVDCVLTSKIFEFVRSGTPILGVGMGSTTTAGQFLVKAGVGYPLGTDIATIKDFLLTNYLKGNNPILHPNHDFINSFSRERLANKALAYLEETVRSASQE